MATIDILRLIEMGSLSPEQKAHLNDVLTKRREELERELAKVEEGLTKLNP